MLRFVSILTIVTAASAWAPVTTTTTTTTKATVRSTSCLHAVQQQHSRLGFFQTVAASSLAFVTAAAVQLPSPAAAADATTTTLPNGVAYTVLKKGDGAKPDPGELVAIRFAAYNGDLKIDDIFESREPYYTRIGSGGLIPGVEQTLPLMKLGDRWRLTIPVSNNPCCIRSCSRQRADNVYEFGSLRRV